MFWKWEHASLPRNLLNPVRVAETQVPHLWPPPTSIQRAHTDLPALQALSSFPRDWTDFGGKKSIMVPAYS